LTQWETKEQMLRIRVLALDKTGVAEVAEADELRKDWGHLARKTVDVSHRMGAFGMQDEVEEPARLAFEPAVEEQMAAAAEEVQFDNDTPVGVVVEDVELSFCAAPLVSLVEVGSQRERNERPEQVHRLVII
jgi:hypothetical protein